MQGAGQFTQTASKWIGTKWAGQADALGKLRTDSFKSLRRVPDAALAGIDVAEEAENAVTVCGAGGERVEMREIVASVETRGAATLFERAEAGEIELPFSGVRREEFGEEFCGALRIIF